jgi:hypothetical protein
MLYKDNARKLLDFYIFCFYQDLFSVFFNYTNLSIIVILTFKI